MFYCIRSRLTVALILIVSIIYLPSLHASSVKFSGALETELSSGKALDQSKSSDLVQATVEFGIEAEISEWVSGNIILLYEEGDTDGAVGGVDEAIITFGNPFLSATSVTVGQQVVPFGFYETNMVSDPLTLEIGETADTAIVFTYSDAFNFSFYLFNGDIDEADEDNSISSMGFNIGYTLESDDFLVDVGVSYISNLGGSNGLEEQIFAIQSKFVAPEDIATTKFISGIAPHLLVQFGSVNIVAEAVIASEEFDSNELRDNPAKPSAVNIEVGLEISDSISIAIGSQKTVDLDEPEWGIPETRTSFGLSYGITDETGIGIELTNDKDYASNGGNSASNFLIQLATEF